ncbi:hypothetical protein KTO58_07795 [Chitinophaga pendula]|uniref:hypothetical protein n=1 Tax=Chitinophaga TaxID=79328 RepID=UPI000BAEEAA0|nr:MULTISPECIES: hypothetical protein [Chitinophaga]ASZ13303.1 hypothetical protein CK934_21240 [Chitinophaga sp. MD30]UCJ09073.1 hypothetical protein KTO58_07795 [Chitinophaga pendula]
MEVTFQVVGGDMHRCADRYDRWGGIQPSTANGRITICAPCNGNGADRSGADIGKGSEGITDDLLQAKKTVSMAHAIKKRLTYLDVYRG